jgi:hypothetical protein
LGLRSKSHLDKPPCSQWGFGSLLSLHHPNRNEVDDPKNVDDNEPKILNKENQKKEELLFLKRKTKKKKKQ